MNTTYLLSICIPTYNRADILKDTLSRIVSYKSFVDDVELVISDNCSTDHTQEVCEAFASQYENVRYYRNEVNIHDRNFISVLDKANGLYLKLINDSCYPTEEGIAFMKTVIREHSSSQTPLFFTNGWARPKEEELIKCSHLDDYIHHVSVMVTFNNLFGVWKQTWDSIEHKERFASLKLQQVDWTFGIVSKGGALIYNRHILEITTVLRKVDRRGYNYFEVLLDNYYGIMQGYADQDLISQETIDNDKRHFLKHFRPELFQALVCHTARYWNYETSGTLSRLFRHYKYKPYFYLFLVILPFQWLFHASVRDFER